MHLYSKASRSPPFSRSLYVPFPFGGVIKEGMDSIQNLYVAIEQLSHILGTSSSYLVHDECLVHAPLTHLGIRDHQTLSLAFTYAHQVFS